MSLCPLVPGERFELPTNGLQNRCSTTELTRQINDLQDRSEAWLQLVAVSSRNSRPAPLEPHLCRRRPGKCPPLSARPREGHPATHSASQTRVNALLPSRGRRCGDPDWPWIPAFAGMSGVYARAMDARKRAYGGNLGPKARSRASSTRYGVGPRNGVPATAKARLRASVTRYASRGAPRGDERKRVLGH